MKFRSIESTLEAEQFRDRPGCAYPPGVVPIPAVHGGRIVPGVFTTQGQYVPVHDGEWIAKEPDGNGYYPIADHVFRKRWKLDDGKPTAADLIAPHPCWLVWSNEHAAWWGPNRSGYYTDIGSAGRYTLADAIEISKARGRTKAERESGVPSEMIHPSPEWIEHALRVAGFPDWAAAPYMRPNALNRLGEPKPAEPGSLDAVFEPLPDELQNPERTPDVHRDYGTLRLFSTPLGEGFGIAGSIRKKVHDPDGPNKDEVWHFKWTGDDVPDADRYAGRLVIRDTGYVSRNPVFDSELSQLLFDFELRKLDEREGNFDRVYVSGLPARRAK